MQVCCSFFYWDSCYARLNGHYEAWSCKKKKHKKIKAHRKSVQKEPTDNRCLLILDLKLFRSKVKGKHSICRVQHSLAVRGKKLLKQAQSRNSDRKTMQFIIIWSRPPSRIRKWNQLRQFKSTSTKEIPIEKLATFKRRGAKGSREAASKGPTVLYIRFFSLSNNSKQQLGAPTQAWQQHSMQGRMIDLQKQRGTSGERYFIERIKAPVLTIETI